MFYYGKNILITGGSGFIGTQIIKHIIKEEFNFNRIVVYSRDWLKQKQLREEIGEHSFMRYFIGDVRDAERLNRAMKNIDICIHAAALKDVMACEFNPFDAIQTNIIGTKNVIEAALNNKVKKSLLISTDKACMPINLYGATKLAAEKLFLAANIYSGNDMIKFGACRYGNVFGSSGSVYHVWKNKKQKGEKISISNRFATRFFMRADDAVKFIFETINDLKNSEVVIKKMKSFRITDLAYAMGFEDNDFIYTGLLNGEKLHENLDYGYNSGENCCFSVNELRKEIRILEGYDYFTKGGK